METRTQQNKECSITVPVLGKMLSFSTSRKELLQNEATSNKAHACMC